MKTSTVGWVIDVAIALVGLAGAFGAGVAKLLSKYGAKKLASCVTKVARYFGATATKAAAIGNAVLTTLDYSLGNGIARLLDRFDRDGLNGYITY